MPVAAPTAREVWKDEVAPRLGEPDGVNYLEDFPGERFYWLSCWRTEAGDTVSVAEASH
jgi:hypothetical protein